MEVCMQVLVSYSQTHFSCKTRTFGVVHRKKGLAHQSGYAKLCKYTIEED